MKMRRSCLRSFEPASLWQGTIMMNDPGKERRQSPKVNLKWFELQLKAMLSMMNKKISIRQKNVLAIFKLRSDSSLKAVLNRVSKTRRMALRASTTILNDLKNCVFVTNFKKNPFQMKAAGSILGVRERIYYLILIFYSSSEARDRPILRDCCILISFIWMSSSFFFYICRYLRMSTMQRQLMGIPIMMVKIKLWRENIFE